GTGSVSSAASTASIRSISARHLSQAARCSATTAHCSATPSRYAINSSSFMCFMTRFPSRVPALLSPRTVATHDAISAPLERQCFSPRSNWISRLPRFLRFRNLPNGASQKLFFPLPKERPALAPSVFGVRDSASTVLALVLHPGRDSRDRFPFHRCLRLSAFPGARLPSVAGAYGQSRSSRRCDKPKSRNLLVRQTDRVFDIPAKTPP